MNILRLFKSEIVDRYIRENFQRLEDYLRKDAFFGGRFTFLEYTVASGTVEVPHTLGFVPKDVVQLSISPDSETVVWNTDDFTRTTLSLTVSGACTVRAYVGRYGDT